MAIDLDVIRNKFIDTARTLVGARLATITQNTGGGPVQVPAVFKTRLKMPQADHPYIVFTINTARKIDKGLVSSIVNDSDIREYTIQYEYLCSYSVYGGDAKSIAVDLESLFHIEEVRDSFRSDGIGAIVEIGDVIPTEIPYENDYLEIATFDVVIGVTDTVSLNEGIINTVTADLDIVADPADTPINITIPVP